MKNSLLFFIFIFGLNCFAQTHSNNLDPAKNITTNKKGQSNAATIQNLMPSLKHDTCLNKQFSIVFNVILDSSTNVVSPLTLTYLNQMMTKINSVFKRICVSFTSCSTVLIPQYEYGYWQKSIAEPVITSSWYTDKTINLYVVDTVLHPDVSNPEDFEGEGYTYGPPPYPLPANYNYPKHDLIVMPRYLLVDNNSAAVLHQLGHFFGLLDTDAEINPQIPVSPPAPNSIVSQEFVNGSNCNLHGDGICDTEADHGSFNYTLADGNGDLYVIPRDNLMSHYQLNRCRFTQEQYNRMAYTILTRRLYLH